MSFNSLANCICIAPSEPHIALRMGSRATRVLLVAIACMLAGVNGPPAVAGPN